ncbi:MAG: NAD(P)-dependent oxidoreductase [Lachnospiraceae bacterium]|nr:NAD(P)-dependent oxidoreductase [Lachnospiraceae bacterium]
MESKVLLKDFDGILNSDTDFDAFFGKTILVTGATGLIGSLFIKSVLYCSRARNLNIKIVSVIRNIEKAKEIFSDYIADDFKFYICDLANDSLDIEENVDYIVHTAAVTTSKDMVSYPVDNIKISVNGTMNVLELAKNKNVKGMVYLSSMEVYGQMNIEDHLIKETELGYIDLSSVRSCYPEGKRMCECLCNSYAKQYDVNVVSARLAQTFGPGISKDENRVFAQFAKSFMDNTDIVLHTKGLSEGNYVYTTDAIRAILVLLVKGEKGQAYNVGNEDNHMTISQMAHLVAEDIADNKIKVIYDIPNDTASMGYAADTKMHLSSEKINSLGWKAQVKLKDMYLRLIEFMRDFIV